MVVIWIGIPIASELLLVELTVAVVTITLLLVTWKTNPGARAVLIVTVMVVVAAVATTVKTTALVMGVTLIISSGNSRT